MRRRPVQRSARLQVRPTGHTSPLLGPPLLSLFSSLLFSSTLFHPLLFQSALLSPPLFSCSPLLHSSLLSPPLSYHPSPLSSPPVSSDPQYSRQLQSCNDPNARRWQGDSMHVEQTGLIISSATLQSELCRPTGAMVATEPSAVLACLVGQRVALAMALHSRPALALDETVTSLTSPLHSC